MRIFAWFRDHRRVSAESLQFVSTRIGTSLLVWLVVGIALALPAGLWIVQVNPQQMSAGWEGRPGLSVYFTPGTAEQDLQAAADTLENLAGVDSVSVTSADQALADFRADAGVDGALNEALADMQENPLPGSVRARFTAGLTTPDLDRLMASAEGLPGVAEVVVEKTWLERLNDLLETAARSARTSINELAESPDELSLMEALRDHEPPSLAASGIDLQITESGRPWTMSTERAFFLSRATKEAITNACKHSRAKTVRVSVDWDASSVKIVVSDDGRGFDVTAARQAGGFGLRAMTRLVREGGASQRIVSAPDQGTRVTFEARRAWA